MPKTGGEIKALKKRRSRRRKLKQKHCTNVKYWNKEIWNKLTKQEQTLRFKLYKSNSIIQQYETQDTKAEQARIKELSLLTQTMRFITNSTPTSTFSLFIEALDDCGCVSVGNIPCDNCNGRLKHASKLQSTTVNEHNIIYRYLSVTNASIHFKNYWNPIVEYHKKNVLEIKVESKKLTKQVNCLQKNKQSRRYAEKTATTLAFCVLIDSESLNLTNDLLSIITSYI